MIDLYFFYSLNMYENKSIVGNLALNYKTTWTEIQVLAYVRHNKKIFKIIIFRLF